MADRAVRVLKKNHRLVRRDLEASSTSRAVDEVVDPIEMIAKLRVERAIPFVGAARQLLFLRPADPLDLVIVAMPALRARERHGLQFLLLGEEIALVQGHTLTS